MKKSISEVNKEYDMEFFGDFPKESVVDLTYIPGGVTENTNINLDEFTQILQIKLPIHSKQNVLDVIRQLEEIDEILWVGPNHIEVAEKQPISASTPSSGIHRYPSLWGLHDSVGIYAEQAWDFTTGNDNIRVGVIDSGMFNHNDISGNMSTDGGDFVNMMDEDNNIPGPLRADPDGHGTHVSGTIGATGTNPNGITGVAWNVELVPLQVSYWDTDESDWMWNVSAVTRAITWAMNNDIDIINYSGGGTSNNIARRNAMNNFNGLFVVAAGNGGNDAIGDNNDVDRYYPSDYSRGQEFSGRVISVGAYERVIGTTTNNVIRCGFSNFGEQSVSIFAPGNGILSTLPSTISSTGYGSWGGTSMATPHVTGTAVLLWDILENSGQDLTRREIAERIKIAIINSAVTNDVGSPLNNLSVSDGRLNAYNAIKYVLENYMNLTTYTLSNYSSTINTNKTIASDASYFNELNGFYKLNVTYAKSYEFIASSTSGIEVNLYDEDFTEILYDDLDSASNRAYFIQNLSVGTYYLRVAYENELNTGTINTEIISRNTAYLGEGENDILINTYNNDDEYNFINHNGPGFYKFSIEATKADGSVVTYTSLKIYDHMNSSQEDKYNIDGYSELAQSIDNNNYLYMYLERNGYYYIHVNMPDASYTSVKLNIERVSVEEIEVASRFDEAFTETLINSNDMTEYATGFSIDQTSVFTIDVTTSQTYTGNITFILFRKAYNNDTKEYYIDEVVGDYIPLESDELRKILVEGTYYIGFFGNTSNVPVTIKINRIVTTSEITDQVLVMDINENLPYGTEVRHNGGEYGEKTITEGFTRHIHFQNVTGVPSVSRYDYSFYSSNKNYATVSEFGTVFAKSVTGNKTVTITAVYKYDPAIIFTIELTIIDDTSNTEKVIETTQTISLSEFENGKYKLVLDENNSPYPWIQYYNWSVFVPCQADDIAVTIDNYGFLTTSGVGSATLTGTYSINPNVTLIIHINFVE